MPVYVLEPKELAKRWNVCRLTVINLCQRGDLHYFKVGAHYKIRTDDIRAFEDSGGSERARALEASRAS